METKIVESSRVNEKYYEIDHKSGLKIFIYPKEGYSSSYAIFGTKYGSINNAFSLDGGEVVRVPDGIAHYLEHKLFESEDLDAFARYAKTGANANAYTSFDKTCYLFSCTENFCESLEILLDFVQSPYFTKETVEKEQGIIGQEIKMYDDSPNWVVMFNMLDKMYKNHPVKIDIAGTVESIAKITPEYLYQCYNTFYNLNNMVLCCSGNVTVDEVLSVCDKMLKPCEKHEIKNFFEKEDSEVEANFVEKKMMVAMPLFCYGYKENSDRRRTTKEVACIDVLLSLLASTNSKLYRKLLDEGLINQSFSYEFFEGEGFSSVMFSGESRDSKKVSSIISQYINDAKANGLDKEDFEITKKSLYGEAVASLNSVDTISNMLADLYFSNRELFEYIDSLASITYDDVNDMLKTMLNDDKSVLSVVSPME